jgi:acetyltransferase
MLAAGVPSFTYPEQVATTLARMARPAASVDLVAKAEPPAPSKREVALLRNAVASALPQGGFLPPALCENILETYGFDVARSAYIATSATTLPESLRFPLVAKIDHPEVIHKSEAGGIILDILDPAALAKAVATLSRRFPGARGILVQEQVGKGIEILLGLYRDPALGHTLTVGSGGVRVEVDKDVATGWLPLRWPDTDRLLRSLRCFPVLEGWRGAPGVDLAALRASMIGLQNLAFDFPAIAELDINPLISTDGRLVAVDSRIRIS